MGSLKTSGITAGLTFLATITAVQAADVPHQPPMIEPLPPLELRGGFYLRGFVGMTNQELDGLHFIELDDPDQTFEFLDKGGFDSGVLFGGGIGYSFNDWFRMDVTGEYRGKTDFTALDRVDSDNDGDWNYTNDYSGKKSEWLVLLNAYADLGTWQGITPYIGAGIGASRNTISHFRDVNLQGPSSWYASKASKWDFAWALHAGVGYEVTDQLTLDLSYRYVDLGDAETGTNYQWDGGDTLTPVHFEDITSHDVLFGLRWNFGHTEEYMFPVAAKY